MSWGTADPSLTALYRAQTAVLVPITLIRKRCSCGKVVTAKQLRQYGACNPCVRAAAAANCTREAA
jgi:hypothetical protein